jgi:hypothetical protein
VKLIATSMLFVLAFVTPDERMLLVPIARTILQHKSIASHSKYVSAKRERSIGTAKKQKPLLAVGHSTHSASLDNGAAAATLVHIILLVVCLLSHPA